MVLHVHVECRRLHEEDARNGVLRECDCDCDECHEALDDVEGESR